MSLDVREETPRGRGAVSVVRVRGAGALADVGRLCARADLRPGAPHLVRLLFGLEDLDEALVCVIAEDDVEIHLHGSPVLVRALIRALAPAGAQENAAPVAAEARALSLLARAPCESAARILLDQAEGAWRAGLTRIAQPDGADRGLLRDELERLAEAARVARFALEPVRVVLAGPVNAGKSTLFNVLAGERRALTSAEPGTTRDLVRAVVPLGAYAVELCDTAGERDTTAHIERAGQDRARAERARADIVLWLTDAGAEAAADTGPVPPGSLHVRTCADRVPRAREPAISALRDPARARATIGALVRAHFELPEEPWSPGAPCAFDAGSRALSTELVDLGRAGRDADARQRARAALGQGG